MSYTVNDVDGQIGLGPSTTGLVDMKAFAKPTIKQYPSLAHLFEYGWTGKTIALSTECNSLARKCNDKNVQHSFTILAQQAMKAKEILALEH